MSPLCHDKIILTPMSETYCMRLRDHEGPHSIYMDPKVVVAPPPKVTSTPLTPFILKER